MTAPEPIYGGKFPCGQAGNCHRYVPGVGSFHTIDRAYSESQAGIREIEQMSKMTLVGICLSGLLTAGMNMTAVAADRQADDRLEIQFRNQVEKSGGLKRYLSRTVPYDTWEAPKEGFRFQRKSGSIVVLTRTSRLVFSEKTGNIVESSILGTPLGNIPYPNLVIKRLGRTYTQNNSAAGSLDVTDDDEKDFLVIRGKFRLTSQDGRKSFDWSVTYRICKENGYTIVTYANPTNEIRNGSYFSLEHRFNGIERHGMDQLALGCGGIEDRKNWWIGWREKLMGKSDEVYADKNMLNLVMMGNGRIGIASEPPSTMKIFNIEDGKSGYLRVETKDKARAFAWIIVNQSNPGGVAVGARFPDTVTYSLCFYPLREYRRPRMRFASYWTSGLQMGLLGSDLTENLDAHGRHTRRMNEEVHKYKGKVIFMAPNWEISRDGSDQLHTFGEPKTWGSENARQQCWASKPFQKRYFKDLMVETVLDEAGDGARLDCNTPAWCNNTAHGCDIEHSFHALTFFETMRQLRKDYDAIEKKTGREYLIGAANSSYPSVNAFSDWVCSGEGNDGYPSQMICDIHFNSLFYGRDFTLLSGGNSPVNSDSSRVYEQMLERCGTVCFHLYHPTSTHKRASMWKKYSNPLKIFKVNESQVHHPYHGDYTQFVGKRDKELLNILYSRDGTALATLCNRSKADSAGPFEVNLKPLKIRDSRILLFDVNSRTTRICQAAGDGWLRTRLPYPKQYDVSFITIRALPKHPEVIWNSVTTMSVEGSFTKGVLSVKADGQPALESRIYVYCPGGSYPVSVAGGGGTLAAFNSIDRMALIEFVYDERGKASLKIDFAEGERAPDNIDIRKSIALMREIGSRVDRLNYTNADARTLNEVCMKIRNHVHQFADEKDRRAVLEEVNDAERLLFCQQKIIDCPDRVRGLPLWGSRNIEVVEDYVSKSGAVAMDWAVSGPFDNKGFDRKYPPEQNAASAAGKGRRGDGDGDVWKKVTGYYIDFGYSVKSPRLDSVANPRRETIAFARTTVVSPADRKAFLKFRGEGSVRLWLNGREIATFKTKGSSAVVPERRVEIDLRKGDNKLTLKTESGGRGWLFYPMITDTAGKVMKDLRFVAAAAPDSRSPYAHPFFVNVREKLYGR